MLRPFLAAVLLWPAFALAQAPRIDSVSPAEGPIAGGSTVVTRGSGLTGAEVRLDRLPAQPILRTDSEIRIVMPPHDNGIVAVTVRNGAGTAYGEFLYIPPRLSDLPPGHITTVAGIGNFSGDGRPATQAMIDPNNLVLDNQGNIFVEEPAQQRIRRIRPDGIIETYAGTGVTGVEGTFGDGGPATLARFDNPRGMDLEPLGNLFVADFSDRIRRVDAVTGIITTFAGTGVRGFFGDGGPASQAQFSFPNQIAFDGDGNLFVFDVGNARVRRISPQGIITTVAGNGSVGFSGDSGPATQAQLNPGIVDEGGLAVNSAGDLFIADTQNHRVRRVDRKTGTITTVAMAGGVRGVSFDSADNMYFADNGLLETGVRIVRMSPSGVITGTWGFGLGASDDGIPAKDAPLGFIERVRADSAGNILFTDAAVRRVRRINVQSGLLENVAGLGPAIIGETGPALASLLIGSQADLAFLPDGDLLLGELGGDRIRRIDRNGNISTFAGNGLFGLPEQGEVPATETSGAPGLAVEPDGDVLALAGDFLWRIDRRGIIHHVAGRRPPEFSGDGGPASEAHFTQPWDLALDLEGNIFIADSNSNRIRRIDAQSAIVTTVAGSGPGNGFEGYFRGQFCGDGGPAVTACLNTPFGVAVDRDGTIYVGDSANNRIRAVDPSGRIRTFVEESLAKIRLDAAGNLFHSHAVGVFKTSPEGVRTVIAGNGQFSFSGDGGPARDASIYTDGQATGIAIDREGNLYFTDGVNRRVRAVRFGAVLPPLGATIAATGGTPQSVVVQSPLAVPLQATVRDPEGRTAGGVRVDFQAPAQGPGCYFLNGATTFSSLTDRTGVARALCIANGQAGAYAVTARPLASTVTASFAVTNILASPAGPPEPQLAENGFLHAATFSRGTPVPPGGIVAVFGSNLAGTSREAGVLPLPQSLAGVELLLDGIAAPLYYVSPTQLNVQVPFELEGRNSVTAILIRDGRASLPVTVSLAPVAAGVFSLSQSGAGQAAALIGNSATIAAPAGFIPGCDCRPAKRGEYLVIFGTGFGPVTDRPGSGAPSNAQPLSWTTSDPVVTVGGVPARVAFAGLTPGLAGLYQINVEVPAGAPSGVAVAVEVSIRGIRANPTTVALE